MVAASGFAAPAIALAGPASEVVSGFAPDEDTSLQLSIDYELDIRRSAIGRERVGAPGTLRTDPVPVVRDLVFAGSRHTIVPRLELGLVRDLSLGFAVPFVLSDQRTLEFDRRSSPCDFDGDDRTCVNRGSSTTILDGLLPMTGYDGENGGAGFGSTDPMIFRGPTRSGFDQVHVGLIWAAMNQRRDDTQPTWKLGAEARIATGKIARFVPSAPDSATGVGRGVHELKLWTSIARQLGRAEPFVEAWWLAPFATKDGSPFADPGYGARNTMPQQEAGVRFGVEAHVVERSDDGSRMSLEASGRLVTHFEGRAYTEMWEVLAMAGDVEGDLLALDVDPIADGVQPGAHPGVTNVENYLEAGGKLAARITVGPSWTITAGFELTAETAHVITFADAGIDLPACSGGQTRDCEPEEDDRVTPETDEVNPLHVPLIDLVGHRYRARDIYNYVVGVNAQLSF